MENVFRNFYRHLYLRTSGYIPTTPLNQNMYPGDFFQINNGEMAVLGNIFRNGIVEPEEGSLEYGLRLNPASWNFSDGVTKPYSGRGSGQGPIGGEFEFSKLILAFSAKGSFIFRANNPEAIRILNWNDLQQQLIIKLTQTCYSFREVYVVTESVTTTDWTLAIASTDKAELEIATDAENFGLVDIFGHHAAKTIQSKDIEFFQRESKRKPGFFKARKLMVQDGKRDVFISELLRQRQDQDKWAGSFFAYDFYYDPAYTPLLPVSAQASVLDMLQGNDLNPSTALSYFGWADANLDDVEKLFLTYGC